MIKQLFDNKTALGIKTTQALNYIYNRSLSFAVVHNNIEIVKFLLDHAKNLNIDVSKLLKSQDNTIPLPERQQNATILQNILKSPNSKMLDLLLKTLAELENGNENENEAIKTLIHNYPALFNEPKKLALALSHIKSEDQKSFIAHCADILKNYKIIALDKVFVTHPIQIEDDSVKNAIIAN